MVKREPRIGSAGLSRNFVGTNEVSPSSPFVPMPISSIVSPRVSRTSGAFGGTARLTRDVKDRDTFEYMLFEFNIELESQVTHADLVEVGKRMGVGGWPVVVAQNRYGEAAPPRSVRPR